MTFHWQRALVAVGLFAAAIGWSIIGVIIGVVLNNLLWSLAWALFGAALVIGFAR